MSNLKSCGVQKEMTNEVSIQTDQADVVLIPQGQVAEDESPNQKDVPLCLNSQTSRSEFNSTVRNNFLSESKGGSFLRKKKREVERAHIIEKIYSKDAKE